MIYHAPGERPTHNSPTFRFTTSGAVMNNSTLGKAMFGIALAATAGTAFAEQGTNAGTDISNSATVNYVVSTVAQDPVPSNTVTFKVDRKVDLTVAEVGGASTEVPPGAQDQPLRYQVTNLSNDTVDILLSSTQDTGDDFDTSNVQFYIDVDADGVFEPGAADGSPVTTLDNVAEDGSRYVWLVSDIPFIEAVSNPLDDGDTSTVHLVAQAADSTSSVAFTESGSEDATTIDTTLADAAGTASGDGARDGKHSDDDTYLVRTATLTVTKSSRVISDPVNNTSSPKRIPGAIVEYCIDITNTGSTAADTVVVSDAIPANTTYVTSSIKTAATGTGTTCDAGSGTAEDDDATDGAEVDATADFNISTVGAVTIRTSTIAATNGNFKAVFRVQIN